MSHPWLLLLPIAAAAGWFAALKYFKGGPLFSQRRLSKNYLQGLNFLLNEQPDKAVDVFIETLEVDSDTIETHLALGNLFRRRGEVDRAIRVHQNLIARTNLSDKERTEALLSLAKDYLSAGVLDRAETLFKELLGAGAHLSESFRSLLDIYQQEKEWEKAIEMAKQLSSVTGEDVKVKMAHYYCELAEISSEDARLDQSYKYLKQALQVDKNCVRASLLLGGLEYISGRHKHAIKLYKQVRDQNPDFLSEATVPLAEVYQALGDEESFEIYMRNTLQHFPEMPMVLLLSEKIRTWRGDKVAAQFVTDYVRDHPSVAGLHRLLDLRLAVSEGKTKEELLSLRSLTEKLVVDQPNYQCEQCGFASKTMLWLCPGCKHWGLIKSAHLLEEA